MVTKHTGPIGSRFHCMSNMLQYDSENEHHVFVIAICFNENDNHFVAMAMVFLVSLVTMYKSYIL